MKDESDRTRHASSAGFSLIELLIVVAIMMILAAVSLPMIGQYIRNYRIRGAAQQVAAAIQTARNRAIMKNVNNGVDIIFQSATQYWIHVEDDQSSKHATAPVSLDFSAPDAAQSTSFTLPYDIVLATSSAECPDSTLAKMGFTGSFAPGAGWLRFSRLGNMCVGCTPVPGVVGTPTNAMMNNVPAQPSQPQLGGSSVVCLYQPATGLSRAVAVSVGGRVQQQQ